MSTKGVVVARPLTTRDPLFIRKGKEYLFPKAIHRLVDAELIHDPVICLPESTPVPLRKALENWEIACHYSPHELPQQRLNDLLDHDSSEDYLVLTNYSCLLFEEAIDMGIDEYSKGGLDLVSFKELPAYSNFALANRRCIRAFGTIPDIAVTPFVFSAYAPDSLATSQLSLSDDWFNAFNLLVKTLYYGDGGNTPSKALLEYHARVPSHALFSRASYSEWLSHEFSLKDINAFARELSEVLPPEDISRTAAKIHILKRIMPHLPEKRRSFLEIGFGGQPLSAQLLLNAFDHGAAMEPFAEFTISWPLVETLSRHLGSLFGLDLTRTRHSSGLEAQLHVSSHDIHTLDVPNGSMDFIFSKTVLEHVMDIESFSRRLFDLLAPSGVMFHITDHSDHIDVKTIRFDFLKHDPATWCSMQGYTNLIRINDLVELWERIGFTVEIIERHQLMHWTKPVHPHWNAYEREDLFCYSSALVATKPKA